MINEYVRIINVTDHNTSLGLICFAGVVAACLRTDYDHLQVVLTPTGLGELLVLAPLPTNFMFVAPSLNSADQSFVKMAVVVLNAIVLFRPNSPPPSVPFEGGRKEDLSLLSRPSWSVMLHACSVAACCGRGCFAVEET